MFVPSLACKFDKHRPSMFSDALASVQRGREHSRFSVWIRRVGSHSLRASGPLVVSKHSEPFAQFGERKNIATFGNWADRAVTLFAMGVVQLNWVCPFAGMTRTFDTERLGCQHGTSLTGQDVPKACRYFRASKSTEFILQVANAFGTKVSQRRQ